MRRHHRNDPVGDSGAAFDEHLRDTLRAAATSTSADENFVERLISERRTRARSVTWVHGRRAWLAPLAAAAAVAAIVFATVALTRSPHAAPVPGAATLPTTARPTSVHETASPSPTPRTSIPATRTPSPRPLRTHIGTQVSTTPTPTRSTANATTSNATTSTTTTSAAAAPPTDTCTTRTGYSGTTVTLCSGSAAVGQTVTITGDGLCGASGPRNLTLIFDGPKSYSGSGGGGNEVPLTVTRGGFVAHYRIPATYSAAYRNGHTGPPQRAPVRPGTGYDFYTLPADGCYVPLTVTP